MNWLRNLVILFVQCAGVPIYFNNIAQASLKLPAFIWEDFDMWDPLYD